MNKLFYKVNEHLICLLRCPYNIKSPITNEIVKIGSSLCSDCNYNKIYNPTEKYVVCEKHNMYIRKEKITQLNGRILRKIM